MWKQPSNPIEACSVDEQEDVEHDVKSDPVFRRDANSSVTESPEAYQLECAEVLL